MDNRDDTSGRGGKARWLGSRAGRREYWLWVVPLLMLTVGLVAWGKAPLYLLASIAILLIWVRRLHDLGRSGWWALAINGASNLTGLALAAILPGPAGMFLGALANLAPLIALGALPGQPHANRFGPPPGGPDNTLSDTFK